MASPRRRTPRLLALGGAAVALAMVLPVVHLAVRATDQGVPVDVIRSSRTIDALVATLLLGVTVTVGAVGLGLGLGWLLERSDLPGRRALGVLAALPLAVPTYVTAVALRDAFGASAVLVEVPGLEGLLGAAAALTLSTYPYVLLLVRAALASADRSLEEAGRSLGDSPVRVWWRVVVPALRPALAAGGLLVFLYVLSDFGAVSILRYRTLTVAIFTEFRTTFDRTTAAVLGLVLVALTLAAIGLARRLGGRVAPAPMLSGVRPPAPVALGRWTPAGVAAVVVTSGLGLGVPVGVLAWRAAATEGRSDSAGLLGAAAATSFGLSAAAAVASVAVALPVAVLAVRHRSRFSRAVEAVSSSGYALPGLVIALALVFFAARYVPAIYQTLSLVVVAYVVRFFPEALGAARSSLAAVDPVLEDAGRSLGRSGWQVTMSVTLPLVRGGLLAGAALVFLTAMKELPATLLLRPAGYDTLATRVWTGAAEGLYRQAAPPGLLLVAISALALWPLGRLGRPDRTVPTG